MCGNSEVLVCTKGLDLLESPTLRAVMEGDQGNGDRVWGGGASCSRLSAPANIWKIPESAEDRAPRQEGRPPLRVPPAVHWKHLFPGH